MSCVYIATRFLFLNILQSNDIIDIKEWRIQC